MNSKTLLSSTTTPEVISSSRERALENLHGRALGHLTPSQASGRGVESILNVAPENSTQLTHLCAQQGEQIAKQTAEWASYLTAVPETSHEDLQDRQGVASLEGVLSR